MFFWFADRLSVVAVLAGAEADETDAEEDDELAEAVLAIEDDVTFVEPPIAGGFSRRISYARSEKPYSGAVMCL